MAFSIGDDELDAELTLFGLRFEPNAVHAVAGPDGWFTTKLSSSEGPLVSDFVTHEASFTYRTYGIHIGQDDRLTFMGAGAGPIVGHFVDCRAGSPTQHQRLSVSYAPSLARRLVVPMGVAHTFDGLGGIVTRDEPVWYADEGNVDWNINNDLVSVLRDVEPADFPLVRPNRYRLSDQLHQFQSRLSQSLLETPTSYSARFLLTIGGEDRYVMFQPRSWTDDAETVARLLDLPAVPGLEVHRSRYAITGPSSWTLVPSTGSCVADVLVLPGRSAPTADRFLHRRTRKWYTFLDQEGCPVRIDLTDRRPGSPTYGCRHTVETTADPRVAYAIDPGVAYAITAERDVLVRCEHEVYVATDEPRADLPPFGADLLVLADDGAPPTDPPLPTLRCPDDVVRTMARVEQVLAGPTPTEPVRSVRGAAPAPVELVR